MPPSRKHYYTVLLDRSEDLSLYLDRKESDETRVKIEIREIDIINEFLNKLTTQINNSKKNLDELYSYNVIYPKYRNLIAVCSFLDYFSAGLCYTFESPKDGIGGAYYLFENEMLHKQIITELQKVNQNLEQIKFNQYSLFSAISESNKNLSELNNSIQTIAIEQEKSTKNTAELVKETKISNYYAEQTQKELSYLNNMQYLSGKYDSVNPLFKTPPT